MKCTSCMSENYVMNGKVLGRHRYLCNDCGYTYSVRLKNGEKSFNRKFFALGEFLLYISRHGGKRPPIRKFALKHGIHHSTLIKWLDKYEGFLEINPEFKDATLLQVCKAIFIRKPPNGG